MLTLCPLLVRMQRRAAAARAAAEAAEAAAQAEAARLEQEAAAARAAEEKRRLQALLTKYGSPIWVPNDKCRAWRCTLMPSDVPRCMPPCFQVHQCKLAHSNALCAQHSATDMITAAESPVFEPGQSVYQGSCKAQW